MGRAQAIFEGRTRPRPVQNPNPMGLYCKHYYDASGERDLRAPFKGAISPGQDGRQKQGIPDTTSAQEKGREGVNASRLCIMLNADYESKETRGIDSYI